MSRIKKRVIIKPVLFIACEGSSSEYQYFESWGQTDEALRYWGRVEVYPDENEDRPKTTPYQLFEKAKRKIADGSANFAWIVFDKDKHPPDFVKINLFRFVIPSTTISTFKSLQHNKKTFTEKILNYWFHRN